MQNELEKSIVSPVNPSDTRTILLSKHSVSKVVVDSIRRHTRIRYFQLIVSAMVLSRESHRVIARSGLVAVALKQCALRSLGMLYSP